MSSAFSALHVSMQAIKICMIRKDKSAKQRKQDLIFEEKLNKTTAQIFDLGTYNFGQFNNVHLRVFLTSYQT